MASKTFTVINNNHTGVTVKSLEESLKFWHSLLGFEILYRRSMQCNAEFNPVGISNAAINTAMLAVPGGKMLELVEYSQPEDRKIYQPKPCDVGSVHIALEVSDAQNLIDNAAPLGWRAVAPKLQQMKRLDGSMWGFLYMHGPEGETVELMEKLE